MDTLNKLRLLSGIPVKESSARDQRIRESEQLSENIGHPLTAGGKYRFFLVLGAYANSELEDVISEVDVRALCDITRGTKVNIPHKEQWELFPVDKKREAVKLARDRIAKAQQNQSGVKESLISEDHFKKGDIVKNDDKEYEVVDIKDEGTDDEVYVVKCSDSETRKEKEFKPEELKKSDTTIDSLRKQSVANEAVAYKDSNGKDLPTAKADRGRAEYEKRVSELKPLMLKYRTKGRDALTDQEWAKLQSAFNQSYKKVKEAFTAASMSSYIDMYEEFQTPAKNDDVTSKESPTQMRNVDDATQKIKVPADIKKSLKDLSKEARAEADQLESRDTDTARFYNTLAQAFEDLLGHLEKETVYDMKKAQIFMSSLMGPILHKIPADVVKFVSYGGQPRSVKDYFKKV